MKGKLILFSLLILIGCAKTKCYSCRDSKDTTYYVKGQDTIEVYGGTAVIFQNLVDSGFTPHIGEFKWLPFYVTYCYDAPYVIYHKDSCHLIK